MSKIKKYFIKIKNIINSDLIDSINHLNECDVLFFCHDVNRPLNLNSKAYSPLIDSLREDFLNRGLSCRSIAYPWSSLTRSKAIGEPVSFNMDYLCFLLINKLLAIIGKKESIGKNPYVKILQKSKAKLVLTIGSPKELALVARESGVFHVELLHGMGYTSIEWGWSELAKKYLPQGILSLDITSTNTFSPLKEKNIEIYTIPHPFLKRFNVDKLDSLPAEWMIKNKSTSIYLKHILVSFNWGYAGDHGPYIKLANILNNGLFFDEIGELVREESSIFWHFRFHPVQLMNPLYKNLRKFMDDFVFLHPNSEWRETSRVPFPSIAMHCDGNIGMSSTSCYDAAAMGVPSLMLCPNLQKGAIHQDWFVDLENEFYVTKAKVSKEMLSRWVHQTQKMKKRLSNLNDNEAWEHAFHWMLQKSRLEYRIKR